MNGWEIVALVCVVLAVLSLVVCVPCLILGARSQAFDRHVQVDLDLLAADDRNTRLDANANGRGWY